MPARISLQPLSVNQKRSKLLYSLSLFWSCSLIIMHCCWSYFKKQYHVRERQESATNAIQETKRCGSFEPFGQHRMVCLFQAFVRWDGTSRKISIPPIPPKNTNLFLNRGEKRRKRGERPLLNINFYGSNSEGQTAKRGSAQSRPVASVEKMTSNKPICPLLIWFHTARLYPLLLSGTACKWKNHPKWGQRLYCTSI